jgi:hypothetical protein
MLPPAETLNVSDICERLHELIREPSRFGVRENLPRRVMDLLTSTRKALMEYLYDGRTPAAENGLAAELFHGDAEYCVSPVEDNRPFNLLLSRRMEQLHLSPHDIAVSLGSTLQYVSDLRSGVKMPTEQRVAEFALLLCVSQESLRAAVTKQAHGMAATV